MKVACVCPFSLKRLTGTPIRAQTTIAAIAEDHDVIVIARETEPCANATVYSTGLVGLFSFTRLALAHLRFFEPEIVHGITTASALPILLYKWFFKSSARIIFEMHGWAWFEQKHVSSLLKRSAFSGMDYLGLWFSQAVIAVSKTEKKFLSRRAFGTRRIMVVWDPVDFDNVYKSPAHSDHLAVGYIGNSAWWQGLHHLIDAAQRLKEDTRISFRLAGFDAGDVEKFPRLPRVEYVGRVERADVVAFLENCDVLVSPRLPEKVSNLQFPHKLSEYLAVGRPVIVSSASDQSEVVREGKCGIVADPLSGETVAEAIKTIAALPEKERKEWGERAYVYARQTVHADVFSRRLKEVYASVMR